MRKTTATILALLLALSLAACGGGNQEPAPDTTEPDVTVEDGNEDDDYGLVETEEGYYQEFEFYNSTAQPVVEMYASAGGTNQWGDNMLSEQIDPDGASILTIYINPGDTTDFRVVAENGSEHELRGYKLENFTVLELVANDDGSATVLLS